MGFLWFYLPKILRKIQRSVGNLKSFAVNSTGVLATSLHSLSPWSSACFHLHPNPPLHPERQDDSSGSSPLRVCLCSLLLTIAICTCSRCRQVSPRQVELIVGVIGIITIRTLQLIIFLISNYPYPSPLTLAYLNN